MSAACRNTSPGISSMASRITRSCVTLLPAISTLFTMAGWPSAIAHDFEGADAVGLALADAHHQRSLPGRLVDDEGVAERLEVDVAPLAIELWQPLLEVGVQLLVVVLARAEPPEALGPGLHLSDDLLVREVGVPRDLEAGDRDAASLLDVEDHADASGVGLVHVQGAHVRLRVALGAVQPSG